MRQKFEAPAREAIPAHVHRVLLTVDVDDGARTLSSEECIGEYVADIVAPAAYGEHLIRAAALQLWRARLDDLDVDGDVRECLEVKAALVDVDSHQDASDLGKHAIASLRPRLDPAVFLAPASCRVTPSEPWTTGQTIVFDAEPWLRQIRGEKISVALGEHDNAELARDLRGRMVQWLIDNGHEELRQAAADGDEFADIALPALVVSGWLRTLTEAAEAVAEPGPQP